MFSTSKMNILALCGSPRKNGNTETLLNEAIRPVREAGHSVTILYLNTMNIKPCQNCGGCNTTGECIIRDDMDTATEAIRKADRIILASPIFFFALSAQVKTMIDRCQSFWCEKYLLKKPIPEGKHGRRGLLLLVGGMKKETGMQCAEACARAFFRTVSVPEHETLFYLSIDAKGDILNHPSALKDAYEAGKRMMERKKA